MGDPGVCGQRVRPGGHLPARLQIADSSATAGRAERAVREPDVASPAPRRAVLGEAGAAIEEGHSRGDLMLDAAIMALCREHGVTTILSADRDFRRFPSITLQPL